jgi:alpha-galactosidase
MKTTIEQLSEFRAGDIRVRYVIQQPEQRVGLMLIPESMIAEVAQRRTVLNTWPEIAGLPKEMQNLPANGVDSLVHLKLSGTPYTDCHGQGRTMRDAPDTMALSYESQTCIEQGAGWTVTTILEHPSGAKLEHRLSWDGETPALTVQTAFINQSSKPLKLEMLTSFSLGGITPFAADDSPRRLIAHRFRSAWSAEGFYEALPFESLHLEPSWQSSAIRSERYGSIGSFPVNGFHPWGAIEDKEVGVFWGAYLCSGSSWQMEFFRRCDTAALSGGLADREFGHWMKTVAPGERFEVPPAFLACCKGSVDDLCDRLRAPMEKTARETAPPSENDLPIVFNEWCTTWGDPSHKRVTAIADRLKKTPVKYLVLDAGWYKPDVNKSWHAAHGDWIPNKDLFPEGLNAVAEAIRERGMIPGLWFEYETLGKDSAAWNRPMDQFLCRDGAPIEVAGRRFWNLNNPAAVEYLHERVVNRLKNDGFGYIKIDYNATVGIGADHPDSPGEGLRLQTEAVHRFIEAMRREIPELVMENCASGGHRLEPSFMMRHAMASFSDAHETLEIPVIAANVQRLIPPRQSQIWAVLRAADDDKRLRYSLAATFLGRMCLSGEIDDLSDRQFAIAREAMNLYREIWPIIADGTSRRYGTPVDSHRHLLGGQTVVRTLGDQALVVVHSFAGGGDYEEVVPLFSKHWKIEKRFGLPEAAIKDGSLHVSVSPLDGGVLWLLRK